MHPAIIHRESKQTCMNFPNLLELSFRTVLALPEKNEVNFEFLLQRKIGTESFQNGVGF